MSTPTNLAYGINCRADHPNDIETGGGPGIVFCDELKSNTFSFENLLVNDASVQGNLSVTGNCSTGDISFGANLSVPSAGIFFASYVRRYSASDMLTLDTATKIIMGSPAGLNKNYVPYKIIMKYHGSQVGPCVINGTNPILIIKQDPASDLNDTITTINPTGFMDQNVDMIRSISTCNYVNELNNNNPIPLTNITSNTYLNFLAQNDEDSQVFTIAPSDTNALSIYLVCRIFDRSLS